MASESGLSGTLASVENLELVSTEAHSKTSIFIGKKKDDHLILIVQAKPPEDVNLLMKPDYKVEKTFGNERFSKYETIIPVRCEISTICPALNNELYKFRDRRKNLKMYYETPEEYKKTVEPFINITDLKWIRDIFAQIDDPSLITKLESDQPQQAELVLHSDETFALLPDLKWDRKDMNSVYCLAIVRDESLRSVRDLRSRDIPMLTHIMNTSLHVMAKEYGVDPSQIRAYFHYHPTYWWLHIHFNIISYRGAGTCVDDALPLMSVINNLGMLDDYYGRATIPLVRAPFSHEN